MSYWAIRCATIWYEEIQCASRTHGNHIISDSTFRWLLEHEHDVLVVKSRATAWTAAKAVDAFTRRTLFEATSCENNQGTSNKTTVLRYSYITFAPIVDAVSSDNIPFPIIAARL